MVRLYRYDMSKKKWVFCDLGVRSKVWEYTMQGYLVLIFNKEQTHAQ